MAFELEKYMAVGEASSSLFKDIHHEAQVIVLRSLPSALLWSAILSLFWYVVPDESESPPWWFAREILSLVSMVVLPVAYALRSRTPSVTRHVHTSCFAALVAASTAAALVVFLAGRRFRSEILMAVLGTGAIWTTSGVVSGLTSFFSFVSSRCLLAFITVAFGCVSMGAQQLTVWYFTMAFWLKQQEGITEFLVTGIAYPVLAALMGKVMLAEVMSRLFLAHFPGISHERAIRSLAFIAEITFYMPCEMVALMVSSDGTFAFSVLTSFVANISGLFATTRLMRSGYADRLLQAQLQILASVNRGRTRPVAIRPASTEESEAQGRVDSANACQSVAGLSPEQRHARRVLLYSEVIAAESFVGFVAPLCVMVFIQTRAPCMVQFSASAAVLRVAFMLAVTWAGALAKKRVLWYSAGVHVSAAPVASISPFVMLSIGAPLFTMLHAMEIGLHTALLLTGVDGMALTVNMTRTSFRAAVQNSTLC